MKNVEQRDEKVAPACTCLSVPRVTSLDGRDGWIHIVDDCPQHGRNRVIPPASTEGGIDV